MPPLANREQLSLAVSVNFELFHSFPVDSNLRKQYSPPKIFGASHKKTGCTKIVQPGDLGRKLMEDPWLSVPASR